MAIAAQAIGAADVEDPGDDGGLAPFDQQRPAESPKQAPPALAARLQAKPPAASSISTGANRRTPGAPLSSTP